MPESNQEIKDQAKKTKSDDILNATLIGIMMGVIIYSILNNTVGLFTLIPLFFAYKLLNKSDNKYSPLFQNYWTSFL